MPELPPAGLGPVTPPIRPAAITAPQRQLPALTAAGRPLPPRISVAKRSVRLAADVSQKIHQSMRRAAKTATRMSLSAWCWVKFKTQYQFWLLLIALIAGWWFGIQKPALADLLRAQRVYDAKYQEVADLQNRCNELRQVYEPLRRGDTYAWQMLARHQLGWKQQSEVVSVDRKAAVNSDYTPDKLRP